MKLPEQYLGRIDFETMARQLTEEHVLRFAYAPGNSSSMRVALALPREHREGSAISLMMAVDRRLCWLYRCEGWCPPDLAADEFGLLPGDALGVALLQAGLVNALLRRPLWEHAAQDLGDKLEELRRWRPERLDLIQAIVAAKRQRGQCAARAAPKIFFGATYYIY